MRADDQVVLGREEVEATLPAILEAHGIAEDRSKDVRDRSVLPKQVYSSSFSSKLLRLWLMPSRCMRATVRPLKQRRRVHSSNWFHDKNGCSPLRCYGV